MTPVAPRTQRPGPETGTRPVRPRVSGWRRRDRRWGLVFIGPQLFGMVAFVLLPLVAAMVLAFAETDGLRSFSWVGLTNFGDQLTDPLLWRAVLNTLGIAAITVPIGLSIAMVLATVLNRIRGRTVYLILIFAPGVTSLVAVSMIWQQLLRSNGILSSGIDLVPFLGRPDWLGDPRLVLISVSMVVVWSSLGLNVLLFLAGLQNIPPAVLEAARVDGAGPVRTFLRVIVPLQTPTLFFMTVVSVISSLQTFDIVFILTHEGGPDNASRTIVYHIYDLAFRRFEFGASSAAALLLLVLTLLITLAQFGLQRRLVHYES
ncbi:carbohydrate ABC transporter permease [Phytoactinopolyspora limicola]|uniref:carbohydrate ABC transporter permease n=1 Tax=Phytoactinopolyspora limicola TaxID=2715536 RepID=UPI001A9C688C|nr:sugar ABC transporter permease [Phytoactinopolyspora limicola]